MKRKEVYNSTSDWVNWWISFNITIDGWIWMNKRIKSLGCYEQWQRNNSSKGHVQLFFATFVFSESQLENIYLGV